MYSIDKRGPRWLWLAWLLVVFVQCSPDSTHVPSDSNVWQGVTPGITTQSQLEEILGEPAKIYEQASTTIMVYTDVSSNRPEWFRIDHLCKCVIYYRINMLERHRDSPITLDEILETYGAPEAVGVANYPGTPFAFVYAKQGIMILAHPDVPENAKKSVIYATDYFVPMSLDEYMESFGEEELIDIKEVKSFRISGWEQYEYKP